MGKPPTQMHELHVITNSINADTIHINTAKPCIDVIYEALFLIDLEKSFAYLGAKNQEICNVFYGRLLNEKINQGFSSQQACLFVLDEAKKEIDDLLESLRKLKE